MVRRGISGLLAGLVLLVGQWAAAAESALDAISSDAAVVIRIRSPKATIDKVATLVDLVQPPFGQQVRGQAQAIGIAISNPTLAGVDMSGDWYIAVYSPEEEGAQPGIVYVIPGKDLKAMKEGLGEEVVFHEHGTWGVYSTDKDAAEAAKDRIGGEGDSIAKLIGKDSLAAIDKGDLAVFVNVAGLVKEYGDELEALKGQASSALENLPEGALPNIDTATLSEALGGALKTVAQAITDMDSLVFTINVSKQGIAIEEFVKVKSGSPSDKFLGASSPDAFTTVGTLPGTQALYFGLKTDMSAFMKAMSPLMLATSKDDDAKAAMKDVIAEFEKLKWGPVSGAVSFGGEEKRFQAVTVSEATPGDKLKTLFDKQLKLAQVNQQAGIKTEVTHKKGAEKIGAYSADIITVKMSAEDDAGPEAEQAIKMANVLYGDDGIESRVVFLKDRMVQTMGGGQGAMKSALEAFDSKTTKPSKAFTATRTKLSEKANFVALVDVPAMIANVLGMVSEQGVLPVKIDSAMLEGLQLKESYLGFSVGTEPQAVRVTTFIPVEQMQGIARLAILAVSMQQMQNN